MAAGGKKMQCVYPDCPNSSRTRGLCHGHYQTMRSRVRNEKAAGRGANKLEADLERRGLMLPMGQGGSPARDHLDAFRLGSDVRGRK
jgi:hypothetical protein